LDYCVGAVSHHDEWTFLRFDPPPDELSILIRYVETVFAQNGFDLILEHYVRGFQNFHDLRLLDLKLTLRVEVNFIAGAIRREKFDLHSSLPRNFHCACRRALLS
jgi:hypothetical protein